MAPHFPEAPPAALPAQYEAPGLTRRDLLGLGGALSLLAAAGCAVTADPAALRPATGPLTGQALLADIERRAFRYFWERTDAATGLVPDRWPTPSFCSIAAVGFALSAYPIGVARGFVTREQARDRVATTLATFHAAPQGPEAQGRAGHKGFFYHFLDPASGTRFADCELSTVDTALLLAGVLHCQAYFDRADPVEQKIRALAEDLYARVDWRWAQYRAPSICHGWKPETGFLESDWKGYNEAMLVYLLALGAPQHAVAPDAWQAWTSTYDSASWGASDYGPVHLRFAPMFGHQFTHCWVDFRGIQDDYMRLHALDYFENSRRATYAQRNYAATNPEGWTGYGPDTWGVTACDGPADIERRVGGRMRRFASYAGRGMGSNAGTYDDGTLAPYAAGASIVFAPEIVLPALQAMHARYGAHIYGEHGFHAFNPSFTFDDVKLTHGRLVPGLGWVDTDDLGIELGPLLAMLGNHRGEALWAPMRGHPHLRRGLLRAGFRGAWLA